MSKKPTHDGSWGRPLHDGPDPIRADQLPRYHREQAARHAAAGNHLLARGEQRKAELAAKALKR